MEREEQGGGGVGSSASSSRPRRASRGDDDRGRRKGGQEEEEQEAEKAPVPAARLKREAAASLKVRRRSSPAAETERPHTPNVRRRSSHREAPTLNSVAAAARTLYHERRGSLRTLASALIGDEATRTRGSRKGSLKKHHLHSSSRTPTTTAASSAGGSTESLASSSFNSVPQHAATTAFYDPLEAGKRSLQEAATTANSASASTSPGSSLPVSPTRRNFNPVSKTQQQQLVRTESLRSAHVRHEHRRYKDHPKGVVTPTEVVSVLTLSGFTSDLKAKLLGGVAGDSAAVQQTEAMTKPPPPPQPRARMHQHSRVGRSNSDSGFEAEASAVDAEPTKEVFPIKKVRNLCTTYASFALRGIYPSLFGNHANTDKCIWPS